ncbi:hypothetical protein [Streptomyces sp. NPDC048192]|uniref:hypothetical protein n=1 Tax=Streptomyces sp. NPDC048192 TaxID=3365510 RepID=UPI003721DD86
MIQFLAGMAVAWLIGQAHRSIKATDKAIRTLRRRAAEQDAEWRRHYPKDQEGQQEP